MKLFDIIPAPYRWLALLLGALALLGFGWVQGANHEQGQQAIRDMKSVSTNTGITARWAKGKDDALNDANDRAQVNDAAGDLLANRVVSLRDELATERAKLPSSSLASCRAHAATLNAIFGECTASSRGLAKEAAGHASDSLMYQEAWPK
ncbi:MAG: hypothetical protein V4451_16880 [Pseudomonadota bacterium]